MKKQAVFLIVVIFVLFSFSHPVFGAAAPSNRVVITYASFSEKEGALFVAQDQGFFHKYGLEVKHVYVRSGPIALSALAGGDAHFYSGSPTGAVLGAIAGGLDAVFVAGLSITRRSFVNSSPQVVERLLRALVDAVAFVFEPSNKPAVMRSLARGLRLPRVEDAAEGYEGMITQYETQMYPTVKGIQNAIQLLGISNEKIRGLRAEDLVDTRIVEKLEQERR